MKKLKHSILSLLLLMGACIVSCSNDDGQTSSTDPDEVGGRKLHDSCIEFAFAGPVYSGRQENFDVLSSFQ